MRRFFTFVLMAVSALLLACEPNSPFGGDDVGGDDDNTQEPIPVPKPEPEPDPAPAEVAATLTYEECADLRAIKIQTTIPMITAHG